MEAQVAAGNLVRGKANGLEWEQDGAPDAPLGQEVECRRSVVRTKDVAPPLPGSRSKGAEGALIIHHQHAWRPVNRYGMSGCSLGPNGAPCRRPCKIVDDLGLLPAPLGKRITMQNCPA